MTGKDELAVAGREETSTKRRRALVISHEPAQPPSQIGQRLRARGIELDQHIVALDYRTPNKAQPFPDALEYDLVVLMGSLRPLVDKAPIDSWVYEELDLVRSVHSAGIPLLGVCFGGQLIAEALGGSVETAPSPEIGWFTVENAGPRPNPVGPGPWMQWHHDRFSAPPRATVLAGSKEATQLFQVDRTVGTQFHPEVDVAHITAWLGIVTDAYLAENGLNRLDVIADALQHEAANIAQCHALVDWYLDKVVASLL